MRDRCPHPSAPPAIPTDVDDFLLWRLALNVATAHGPGHDGRCTSLLCAAEPTYPCPPAAAAQQAAHVALRPTPTARGRATVPPPPCAGIGRAALIGAAATVGQPPAAAPAYSNVWPPPLRRPTAKQAA